MRRRAGEEFRTSTGLPFTYRVLGDFIRIEREGAEINQSLSKTSFSRAVEKMPAPRPSDVKDSRGSSYTWAILMDPRIRAGDW